MVQKKKEFIVFVHYTHTLYVMIKVEQDDNNFPLSLV